MDAIAFIRLTFAEARQPTRTHWVRADQIVAVHARVAPNRAGDAELQEGSVVQTATGGSYVADETIETVFEQLDVASQMATPKTEIKED